MSDLVDRVVEAMKATDPIYYCATAVETPAFEPCKEIKGRRDI
jgi:hypothetical protein